MVPYWRSREWELELTENEAGTKSKYSEIVWSPGASAQVSPRISGQDPQHFRIVTTKITEKPSGSCDEPAMLTARADLARLKEILEAKPHFSKPADELSLLNVYTTQFGSYTTMLWQVPALGLTAQAFLMTIALDSPISDDARIAASALSIIIALASRNLMHSQRGRAINQAELARRVSSKLALKQFLGDDFALDDAVPDKTNARNVWAWITEFTRSGRPARLSLLLWT